MQELWLAQLGVPILPLSHELFLGDPVPEMLVLLPVLLDGHPRHRSAAPVRRIVVACPDFDMVWQAEEPAPRAVEVPRATAGEVAACGAYVGVENRVAAEHVVCGEKATSA